MPSAGLIHFYDKLENIKTSIKLGVNALGGLNSFLPQCIAFGN